MKKKFVTPVVKAIKLQSETLLAGGSTPSLTVNKDGVTTTDKMYAKKAGQPFAE